MSNLFIHTLILCIIPSFLLRKMFVTTPVKWGPSSLATYWRRCSCWRFRWSRTWRRTFRKGSTCCRRCLSCCSWCCCCVGGNITWRTEHGCIGFPPEPPADQGELWQYFSTALELSVVTWQVPLAPTTPRLRLRPDVRTIVALTMQEQTLVA